MKPTRLILVVVIGVVLVGGVLVVLGMKRSERLAELSKQAETEARYKKSDAYFKGSDVDKKYVEELFVHANKLTQHELDGFFSPPPAPQKYYTALYQAMVKQAKDHGKPDIAKSLHTWVLGQGYLDVAP